MQAPVVIPRIQTRPPQSSKHNLFSSRKHLVMSIMQVTLGTCVQIQYKVFTNNLPPELVWYNGEIIGLQTISNDSARVTVKFEGSESFQECEETFTADKNGSLNQDGKDFPYRLLLAERVGTDNRDHGTPDRHQGDLPSSFVVRLNSMENRLEMLEQQSKVSPQYIPSLYLSTCCVLNKSFRRYQNAKHKLQSTNNEISSETWTVTQMCTYSDFKSFLEYLRNIRSGLVVNGDEEPRTASPRITISIPSFREFCSLFSISQNNYEGLLACHKYNKKGQLVSFKAMGTFFESRENPSLPSLLCLGGTVQDWCDDNTYFSREHSHTLSAGGYACEFEHLSTRQAYISRTASVMDILTGDMLTVKWSIDDSSEFCRPIQDGSQFIGKLVVRIPYLLFKDTRLATKIHKRMQPNRNNSDSTDSSSSSS